MRAEPSDAPANADWASLSPDLWRLVIQKMVEDACRLPPCHSRAAAVQTIMEHWAPCCRQLAAASAVCRSLRNALLGADAGELWRFAVLSSAHIGMPAQPERGLHRILEALGLRPACSASQQLNRLVASQAQHVRYVILRGGGGWRSPDLRDVVAPLSGLLGAMLVGMDCADEAACISAALIRSSVASVRVEGSVAMCLLASVQELELLGSIEMHSTNSEH